MPLTDAQALDLYVHAVRSQAQAVVCAYRTSWYAAEFERKYDAWRSAHADDLARGAALAETQGLTAPGPKNVAANARAEAQQVNELPSDERRRLCDDLMAKFTPGARP